MKKYLFYVGVDVSKQKLDFNILDISTFKSEHCVIENDFKGISTFVKNLNKKIDIEQTLFCCENTGVYTNHLSSVLANLHLDLWVVPAIEIKRSKDPQLKEYYNKKKTEGKNAMLVLNNIRCKLISRVFAVINRETS